MMKKKGAYLKYIASLLLFGLNGFMVEHIDLSSPQIVVLRCLLGALFLLGIFLLTRQCFTCLHAPRRLLLMAVSGTAMGLSWLCLFRAYQFVGVSIATLLYCCGPVLVMLLSPVLFRERLTLPKLAGIAIVFAGVVLLNGVGGSTLNTQGLLCSLGSAVLYAVMIVANKKAALSGLENTVLQLFFAFLAADVFCSVQSGALFIDVPAASWVWVLLLGLVNTGLGCWMYFSSIGLLPVQTVSVCSYLEPLSAVFFSVLLLDEALTPTRWLGTALVLGGAALAELLHTPAKKS